MPDSQSDIKILFPITATNSFVFYQYNEAALHLLWCSKWGFLHFLLSCVLSQSGLWKHGPAGALGPYQWSQYLGSLRNKGGKGLTHFYVLSFCSPLLWRHEYFRHSVGLTIIHHSCCHCTGPLWCEAFLLKCFGKCLMWLHSGSSPMCWVNAAGGNEGARAHQGKHSHKA